jgi:choline dehydrogenase
MRGEGGETFDFVVVGAGSAGSLLAGRLAEANASVCVLEAGPKDFHPFLRIPAGYIKMLQDSRFTWQFRTEPSFGTAGRRISTTQGRVLGGSSSINGLIHNRGQDLDFDQWAQLGNRGWSYDDVLPYFRRSERRLGAPDPEMRGTSGSLVVSDIDWKHPLCNAFIEAAVSLGINRNEDYNGRKQEGVGYYQRVIHRGLRVSSAGAFLHPVANRRNIKVLTDALAQRIEIAEGTARSVHYRRGGEMSVVHARREVILCCGALNTPKLLQISGIGPASQLKKIGAAVQVDLPGVGENLRDHYAIRMTARVKGVTTINELTRGWRLGLEVVRWSFGLPSVLALSPSLVHVFARSRIGLDRPDLQLTFTPARYREGIAGLLDTYPGMTCGVWQQRPESRGYVRAVSLEAADPPEVQPNYLSDPIDQRTMIDGVRLGRQLFRAPALRPFLEQETSPDPKLERNEELLDYIRSMGSTVFHLMGSCRMGPEDDPMAVVTPELKVRKVEKLRIVDASVMPTMPSANTNATTYMIAEKAADLLLDRSPAGAR